MPSWDFRVTLLLLYVCLLGASELHYTFKCMPSRGLRVTVHVHILGVSGCGSYIDVTDSSQTGTLTSPNYPSQYGNRNKCVWLIRAPNDHNVQLVVTGVAGEADSGGGCADFLEVSSCTLIL